MYHFIPIGKFKFELQSGNAQFGSNAKRSSIEKVPYCFSRSSVKFQGCTALKIVAFDPFCSGSNVLRKAWEDFIIGYANVDLFDPKF